ncbi:MAG: hypothetical protein ACE14P_02515 [Methanotrichaceae archaeon]
MSGPYPGDPDPWNWWKKDTECIKADTDVAAAKAAEGSPGYQAALGVASNTVNHSEKILMNRDINADYNWKRLGHMLTHKGWVLCKQGRRNEAIKIWNLAHIIWLGDEDCKDNLSRSSECKK